MVLSCLRGYHLRCLRPSLLPDSQPLVERDEIIAVLQNSLSLSLSLFPCRFLLRFLPRFPVRLLEDLQRLIWNE